MTSPDVSPYVDLSLYDISPSDLAERAVLDAGVKFPDWTPRDGNTEVVLIESLALTVAELVFAINRLPGATVEAVLKLYGVDRSPGIAPTATVTFDLTAPVGYDIPAGTTFSLALDTDDPLVLTLDSAVAVASGATTATGAVTATRPTAVANGTTAGTPLTVLTALPYVDDVALATPVVGGTDPEDTDAWLTRGTQRLRRLTTTLVLPEHFTAAALDHVEVFRALTLDNFDGSTTSAGHVTVAVLGPAGAALSAPVRAAILADLDARAQANLGVHVITPTITPVAVTCAVVAEPGFDSATVQANVTATLAGYLSPDTWGWGATVYRNELISVIDGAPGVARVVSITAPSADVALTGPAPLAALGTVAVTVS